MTKKIVFMFSGQGSQYFHMGKELYLGQPVFRQWMDRLDRIAIEVMGESVTEYLYHDKRKISESFHDIRYTHPAIFMVEYSLARVMLDKGIEPDLAMGASMGEYAAAAVSGVMSPEDVLLMLLQQAAIFRDTCPPSGLLTILASPDLFREHRVLNENSQLASINYSSHFVVSGDNDKLDKIEIFLKQSEINFQRLSVDFGFHSSYIDAAEAPFKKKLTAFNLKTPEIPYVSCMTGAILNHIPQDYFWQIVRHPIQTEKTIENLETAGSYHYLDMGPSGTMANFVKNNLQEKSESRFRSFITPFGGELKKIRQYRCD